MQLNVRRGDPALVVAWARKHKPNPELADLIDSASKEFRRGFRPR